MGDWFNCFWKKMKNSLSVFQIEQAFIDWTKWDLMAATLFLLLFLFYFFISTSCRSGILFLWISTCILLWLLLKTFTFSNMSFRWSWLIRLNSFAWVTLQWLCRMKRNKGHRKSDLCGSLGKILVYVDIDK